MMDRDPERLVKGAENGSARELLLAARAEEAPRAVRDRVLSTLASAFARARTNAASVPASKLSGIFERLEETSSKPPLVPRSLLERRPLEPLEPLVLGPLDAAPIELRRRSRRIDRAPVIRRTPIALQLGAAVLVGVLVATGVHFASGVASRSRVVSPRGHSLAGAPDGVWRATAPSNPDRAATALRASGAVEANASPRGDRSSAASSMSPRPEARGVGAALPRTPVGVAPVRAISALESPADTLSGNEVHEIGVRHTPLTALGIEPSVSVPEAKSRRGIDVPAGASASVRPAPAGARTTARAAFDELAAEDRGLFSEDWLGEQLALVSRAERRLAEGNPADALRALDEYQARFPKGLLDLEIAALRDKAERHSSPANASEMPRSN